MMAGTAPAGIRNDTARQVPSPVLYQRTKRRVEGARWPQAVDWPQFVAKITQRHGARSLNRIGRFVGLASWSHADYNPGPSNIFKGHEFGLANADSIMTAYVSEVWRLRHFWIALVHNDLRNRYRRSVLGLGWSLLQPITMTIVLCTVFAGVLGMTLTEYAPYLLSGLTFWNFISSAAVAGCQSFLQGESYIRQHRAPLAIYPLRTTLGAGYHFLIGMCVVFVAVGAFSGFNNPIVLLSLLPSLLLLFVFAWSLALCTGTLNALFHDTQHILEIILQILFYMTPIMYKPEILLKRNLGWAVQFNPFAVLLDLIRQPLLEGTLPAVGTVWASLLIVAATVVLAAVLLRWCERRLVFFL
jgi:lipopolysaccharide transport system permease protein